MSTEGVVENTEEKKADDEIERPGSRIPVLAAGFPSSSLLLKSRGLWDQVFAAEYERFFAPEMPEKLRAAGADAVRLSFFSGFGLSAEEADTERAAAFAARARAIGLRVHWYVAVGVMSLDTLPAEEPEARNWVQSNARGLPASAPEAGDVFMVRPCPNSEGWRTYMEKVLARVLEVGADGIHFTNCGWNTEPDTCRCPVCVTSFREFVRERNREAENNRFGFSIFNHLRPPAYASEEEAVAAETNPFASRAPHAAEWRRFKTASWADFFTRMCRFVRRRAPECFLGADLLPSFPTPSRAGAAAAPDSTAAVRHGLSPAALWPLFDAVEWLGGLSLPEPFRHAAASDEEPTAVFVQVRTLKTLAAFDLAAPLARFPLTAAAAETSAELARLSAVQSAFGGGSIGLVSAAHLTAADESAGPVLRDAAALRRLLNEQPESRKTAAKLLILRDWENPPDTRAAALLPGEVETELLKSNVGFAVAPAEGAAGGLTARLRDFRTVLLPEIVRLSSETVTALRAFVEGGGGLVVLGASGVRDAEGGHRAGWVWAKLLGVEEQPTAGAQREFGRGRVVFLPVNRGVEHGAAGRFVAAEDLSAAVRWALGEEGPSWEARAGEGSCLVEVTVGFPAAAAAAATPEDTGTGTETSEAEAASGAVASTVAAAAAFDASAAPTVLAHVVNREPRKPVKDFELALRAADFPFLAGTEQAELLAPGQEPAVAAVVVEEGKIRIRLPEPPLYAVLRLRGK